MALNRSSLCKWVERRLLDAIAPPQSFALTHTTAAGAMVVSRPALDKSHGADAAASLLVDTVECDAREHVEAFFSRQQYALQAIGADGQVLGEFAFHLTPHNRSGALLEAPPEAAGFESLAAEGPPRAGVGGGYGAPSPFGMMGGHGKEFQALASVAAMQMRHTEALMRLHVENSAMHRERDAQIIASQQREIEKSRAHAVEFHSILEEMRCRQAERELEERKYSEESARKDKLLERLNNDILPIIGRRLGLSAVLASGKGAGGAVSAGGGGGGDATDAKTIREIFMGLPPELQDKVIEGLSAENQHALLEIFERHGKQEHDAEGQH